MAQNFAAKKAEAVLGHGYPDRAATTDISNPDRNGGKYADPSDTMKALAWMGKNDVRVSTYYRLHPTQATPMPLLVVLMHRHSRDEQARDRR
jgi:hypothetical protein